MDQIADAPIVEREVTLDADPEAVWRALTDDEARSAWLGVDALRATRVDESSSPARLGWTWWDEGGAASHVTITLAPAPAGGTVLRVVERLAVPGARALVEASAAWARRTLELELLLSELAALV